MSWGGWCSNKHLAEILNIVKCLIIYVNAKYKLKDSTFFYLCFCKSFCFNKQIHPELSIKQKYTIEFKVKLDHSFFTTQMWFFAINDKLQICYAQFFWGCTVPNFRFYSFRMPWTKYKTPENTELITTLSEDHTCMKVRCKTKRLLKAARLLRSTRSGCC